MRPRLAAVKVAVLDSGIDAGSPAFADRIAAGRSFVGGSWAVDTVGHGTFVAGVIAANPASSRVAGIAFNARLLIAKIVTATGAIPIAAEVAAIHWAVKAGARVINISWGAPRDPRDSRLDSYSFSERRAVEWAYSKDVVVVAAAGNGGPRGGMPWPYADYPAWLPNVLSVAALAQNGSIPAYSNHDLRRVDLAAPGTGILSTIPRALENTANPECLGVSYSNCGPERLRGGDGTSFAAPQVTAAAALLLGVDPALRPDQVMWLLERSAVRSSESSKCLDCRDDVHSSARGFGELDIQAAVDLLRSKRPLPPPDVLEPDDDTGNQAHPLRAPALVSTSEDYWDDPVDVFAIRVNRDQRLRAVVRARGGGALTLRIWKPGTPDLIRARPSYLGASSVVEANVDLSYRAASTGTYYLEVVDERRAIGRNAYRLSVTLG